MKRYIALFRGINVGGNNRISMEKLVQVFESFGYKNVRTYIQSGNVIFDSKRSINHSDSEAIAKAVLKMEGFEPKLLILDHRSLSEAIEQNPYRVETGKSLHFYFLESDPVNPDLRKLDLLKSNSEDFHLYKSILYLHAPEGIHKSKLASSIERILKIPTTARNWNTVRKLTIMIQAE